MSKKKQTREERHRRVQELRDLRASQLGKSPQQIREEMKLKEDMKLFEGSFSLIEFFGISGVYYLFRNEQLVYIGESACVFSRITEHIKEGVKEFTHFKYEACENRKELERSLIRKYRPIYNSTYNPNVQEVSKYGRKKKI